MSHPKQQFAAGLTAMAPVLPGVVPFGLTAGIAGLDAGLDPAAAFSMSFVIFAGASQLAWAQLVGQGALPLVVVATALIINLRMAMYSASLAPYLGSLPQRWKWPLAYLLTDQAYAVSIARFVREPDAPARHWYYLGAALPLWLVWLAATAAGIAVGAGVPPEWQLGFAVPLVFLALLVPAVRDRPSLAAAVVGGGVAVLASGLPFNLGLTIGALSGIVAGVLAERLLWPPQEGGQ